MVNAFTFDNGTPKAFNSRKELYKHMIEEGHEIQEGDDAKVYSEHIDRLAKAGNEKAQAMQLKRA